MQVVPGPRVSQSELVKLERVPHPAVSSSQIPLNLFALNEEENPWLIIVTLHLKNIYFYIVKFVYEGPTHQCIKFTKTGFFPVFFQLNS